MRSIIPVLGMFVGLALIILGEGQSRFIVDLIQTQDPASLYEVVHMIGISILTFSAVLGLIQALRRKQV